MSLSIFNETSHPPSKPEIADALGKTYSQWIDLVQFFQDHVSPVSETWKNYGKTSGWTLLLGHKDRTIVYLFPSKRFFTALFVYGEPICRMKSCNLFFMPNSSRKAGLSRWK
jgi:hypothetical protein